MLFEERHNSIIKVIGVGGGGGNAVAYMYKQGIVGVDFAICNTDHQALDISPVPIKVQLGPNLTDGMGAGSVPEVGKQSCIESIDEVRRFLEQDTKMLFITAGMGGGTGTGAAPIIAKAAKEMGILTVAIVTLPFKFEGLRRQNQAVEGLENLKKCVDSILVISNDRLRHMYGNLSLSNAFSKADDILTTAARGIAEIITVPGYINVDFKDVNTVMKNSGVSIMGYAEAEGENRAKEAVEEALNSPLLEDNDIRGAQHILLNISSGDHEVTMDEIGEITEYIQEEAGYGTHMIWGNCNDEALGEKISVTIIATGFDEGKKRLDELSTETIKVHLDEPFDLKEDDVVIEKPQFDPNRSNVVDFDSLESISNINVNSNNYKTSDPYLKSTSEPVARNTEVTKDNSPQRMEELRTKSSLPLDNPKRISEMEDIPAYKRREIELEDVKNKADKGNSKLSINIDENEVPFIERNNSFFHDNVD
ncbi:MAG: cell division protein FtsZ [Saprospiraceae bacterium]|nr:cell division protein FtsZ [Bacteroidia bacterium]NNE13505.1 cell division protein FtsZ [Saprospiraceae bacterium]NNL92569.1 cell division protein FtsZ [Saprospiraceae bacterium]